jgi:hypothetical protein
MLPRFINQGVYTAFLLHDCQSAPWLSKLVLQLQKNTTGYSPSCLQGLMLLSFAVGGPCIKGLRAVVSKLETEALRVYQQHLSNHFKVRLSDPATLWIVSNLDKINDGVFDYVSRHALEINLGSDLHY